MNKKIQLIISVILLLFFISTITYSTNFSRDENGKISYKVVNSIIQKDKDIKNTDVYNTFLKNFDCKGDKYYYSFIELDGYDYPILLLSDAVYKFNNESDVAMGTDIYYPVKKQITRFGGIGSDGTAYPISADKTGIFTSGGHNVAKYGLDIKSGKLKLIYKYIMFFDVIGEEVRAITVGIIGSENKIVSKNELVKANAEYGNANRIYFNRLC
jgi:hypothetical protein